MLQLIAMLLAGAAPGPNWTKVGATDESTTFVDLDTVKVQRTGSRTAWVRRQYVVPENNRIAYRIAKVRYDCEEETATLLSVTGYDTNDAVAILVNFKPGESDTSPQVPGTIGMNTLTKVCEHRL
jgi:hypothetical protein